MGRRAARRRRPVQHARAGRLGSPRCRCRRSRSPRATSSSRRAGASSSTRSPSGGATASPGSASRKTIFFHRDDAARLGLRDGDGVRLQSALGTFDGLCAVGPCKPRHLQAFWPEANVLVGRSYDPVSGEPDYHAFVRVERRPAQPFGVVRRLPFAPSSRRTLVMPARFRGPRRMHRTSELRSRWLVALDVFSVTTFFTLLALLALEDRGALRRRPRARLLRGDARVPRRGLRLRGRALARRHLGLAAAADHRPGAGEAVPRAPHRSAGDHPARLPRDERQQLRDLAAGARDRALPPARSRRRARARSRSSRPRSAARSCSG